MKKFDTIVTKFEEAVLAFSVLLMAGILIGGVISRVVFNASWTFTEELGNALSVVVTFFGVGYCAREARHISMSVVFDLAKPKFQKFLIIVITGATALVMLYLGYLSIRYTFRTWELGRVTAALRIPYWITILPLPFGFFLAAFEYSRSFFINITSREIYISSKYQIGENTDEAVGVDEVARSVPATGEVRM